MKQDLLEYFFYKRFDKFVGLEFADNSIKAVYLTTHKGKVVLQNGVLYKLKPNIILDGQIKDDNRLIAALKDVKGELLIPEKNFPTGIAFPGNSSVTKLMKINKNLYGSEQEEFVLQEINRQLHKKDIEICMDYYIFRDNLNPESHASEGDIFHDVIAVSAMKKDIDHRNYILNSSGFEPKVVDIDYLAFAGACEFLLPKDYSEITVVFYLGRHSISIIVMNHYNVVYSKEATISSELWEYLAYNIEDYKPNNSQESDNPEENSSGINELESKDNLEQGEQENIAPDENKLEDNYTDILVSDEILNQFTDHCYSLLQFFYSSQKGMEIKKIVLGGCFNTDKSEKIEKSILDRFNIDTKMLDFTDNLELSSLIQENKIIKKIAPDMMISLGAALRGFDND